MKRQTLTTRSWISILLLTAGFAASAQAQEAAEQAEPVLWAAQGRVYSKQPANAPITKPKEFFRKFQNAPYIPGQLYVQFRKGATPARQAMANAAAQINRVEHSFEKWLPGTVRVSVPVGRELEAANAYLDDPDVIYAEPVYIYEQTVVPNDSRWGDLWGMSRIRAHDAWDVYTGNANYRIGIVDSGLNWTHPDIISNVWTNPGEIAGNGIDDDGNGYVDDVRGWNVAYSPSNNGDISDSGSYHGTHVAGTIGAYGNNSLGVVGVNWRCKIVMARCGRGTSTIYNAVEGFEYLLDNGIKVSNHSYGGSGYSQTAYNMFYRAQQEGHIAVCAAGNGGDDGNGDNNDNTPHYPSSYALDNIIAVANHNSSNNLSGSSNFGASSVDLAAPGSSILSTIDGASYGEKGGTSMASPHVAGSIALVWARWPYLTWQQMRARILTAVAGGSAFTGKVASNGRLDLARPTGVWVQHGSSGQWGTYSSPYTNINTALPWVPVHGHLMIRPVTTNWTGIITKPMYIEAPQGPVTLGVQ